MAGKRTSVKKIEEIKRYLSLGLTERATARALGVSRNTVASVARGGDEESVEVKPSSPLWCEMVDWERVRGEVAAGVSLFVLWEEEVENGRVKVQYPAFWKHFVKRFPNVKNFMHRVFAPGTRAEVDYCDGISFYCPIRGEVVETQLFMGVLCCSRYTFGEFTLTQKTSDFLNSHIAMFSYF
jgi:DNA-binding XRE family transcriptional regulator